MKFTKIPVGKISRSSTQPRQHFDRETLQELAGSIREVGQLQPIIVREKDDKYILIAGERRLRAIKENEEEVIAAVIIERDLDKFDLRQIQLIENLQRQDLDPMERAVSIHDFIKENDLTKKEAARKLGIPRTTLTEWLNILDVKPRYQEAVLDDDSSLTLSHITLANALASRTGDPVKKKELLNGVLKFNLTRNETRQVLDLFYKYLHLSMEEALSTILIKRERKQQAEKQREKEKSKDNNRIKKLLNSLNLTGDRLEEVVEKEGTIGRTEKERLVDEFLYIYQLLEVIIPEIKDKELVELIAQNREETLFPGN